MINDKKLKQANYKIKKEKLYGVFKMIIVNINSNRWI